MVNPLKSSNLIAGLSHQVVQLEKSRHPPTPAGLLMLHLKPDESMNAVSSLTPLQQKPVTMTPLDIL